MIGKIISFARTSGRLPCIRLTSAQPSNLPLGFRQLFVSRGKGGKDRVVYISEDARLTLKAYLTKRSSKTQALFLVQKGPTDRDTDLRPGNPEENRILCKKERAHRIVPSAKTYYGYPALKC